MELSLLYNGDDLKVGKAAGKKRLDVFLVERGLITTRNRAQAMIIEGKVLVDGEKITKPGTPVPETAEIEVLVPDLPYVSRGGLKLEKAVKVFKVNLDGKVVLDLGASTGGFTDCALKNGARKVVAVDVGYGQLAWKLRQDPRVVNLERKNARYLTLEEIGERVDIITVDLAFISLQKIFPVVKTLIKEDGEIIVLIKPQFEAGRDKVGRRGVVRSPDTHRKVIRAVLCSAEKEGFSPAALIHSPVKGPEGNIEYLAHLMQSEPGGIVPIDLVVEQAWEDLG